MPTPAPRRRRLRAAALAPLLGLPALATFGAGTASAQGILPPTDPPSSIPAPDALNQACYGGGTAAACDQQALAAINGGRAAEGVAPMVLPANYASLTPEQQLLVLVNLERVDRGLTPVDGLDVTLDGLAGAGAAAGGDPVGPGGYAWGSTWAGGEPTALATMFDWIYDDGPSSPNAACPPSCWGHRNVILASMANPTMGGAVAGSSYAALLVDGYPSQLAFSWAGELSALRPAVPPAVTVTAAPGTTATGYIPIVASGAAMTVNSSIGGGGSSLSVSLGSCTAPAGGVCNLALAFRPPVAGNYAATVNVYGPGGPYPVKIQALSGHGYWQATAAGRLYAFGGGGWLGDLGADHLNARIVGMASTPDKGGYWLVAADGGIFAFGDARFYGSTGGMRLNAPVVGMAATPTGRGYWLVAADGGIFAFGDAAFHGSTGGMRLNAPVVAMAPTPDGRGYWMAATDGGIFAFGGAAFHGSTGGMRLNAPVVGMAASPDGRGYLMAARDGGIFAFGDAAFHGSAGGLHLNAPIVGVAEAANGGYWESAADGGVFNYGVPFLGAAPAPAGDPVVAAAAS